MLYKVFNFWAVNEILKATIQSQVIEQNVLPVLLTKSVLTTVSHLINIPVYMYFYKSGREKNRVCSQTKARHAESRSYGLQNECFLSSKS